MNTWIQRLPFAAALLHPRDAASGLIRRIAASTTPVRRPQAGVTAIAAQPQQPQPGLEEARGDAMRRLFPKLYSWCASRWEWSIAVEAHAYLAGATSIEDLEQRIRNVERRRQFGA
jgi:hypothetical protein